MNNRLSSVAKKIAGVFLILVGIAGLFLPFLQGIILIFAGAVLLGNKKLISWLRQLKQKLLR